MIGPDGLQLTFKNKHVNNGKMAVIYTAVLNIDCWCHCKKIKINTCSSCFPSGNTQKCLKGPNDPVKHSYDF